MDDKNHTQSVSVFHLRRYLGSIDPSECYLKNIPRRIFREWRDKGWGV